ncbi:TPA: hypothetical protein DGH83_04480 [Candidatus Peregrinibacteria bacterium]|nr:hypothetical protein [Candidatus Peregrinibacteria bacterium]
MRNKVKVWLDLAYDIRTWFKEGSFTGGFLGLPVVNEVGIVLAAKYRWELTQQSKELQTFL